MISTVYDGLCLLIGDFNGTYGTCQVISSRYRCICDFYGLYMTIWQVCVLKINQTIHGRLVHGYPNVHKLRRGEKRHCQSLRSSVCGWLATRQDRQIIYINYIKLSCIRLNEAIGDVKHPKSSGTKPIGSYVSTPELHWLWMSSSRHQSQNTASLL